MDNNQILSNIGKLSPVIKELIEKISSAIGWVLEPTQIIRIAKAEAKAEMIKTESKIEITDIQNRALIRFIAEEAKMQSNIESITIQALPLLEDTATPRDIEEDWISNFFDKSRLISDEEMQILWSRILADEANNPGKFSKQTINILSSMNKSDALLFQTLCGYGWNIGVFSPLIYNFTDEVYIKSGITFDSILSLKELGLLNLELTYNFTSNFHGGNKVVVDYFSSAYEINFSNQEYSIKKGKVLLSRAGIELAQICKSEPVPGFLEYVLDYWEKSLNLKFTSK